MISSEIVIAFPTRYEPDDTQPSFEDRLLLGGQYLLLFVV